MFGKMKSVPRKLLNRLEKWKCRKEPWLREIIRCQNEIAVQSDVNPYYLRAYKREEIYYWLYIPKWMWEDSKKHKVYRCLDIGCGYGTLSLFAKKIYNCQVYCSDFTDAYLSQALSKKYNFAFYRHNIELDLFSGDVSFDAIILTEVLEHFNFYPVNTLKKIRSLLAKDGRLYLSTPDASRWGKVTKYYSRLDEMPEPKKGLPVVDDHVWQFNKEELFEVLDAAGFTVDRFAYSPGLLKRHFNLVVVPK